MLHKLSRLAACLLIVVGCSKQPAPVAARPGTVAVVNARIWTGDDAQPWAQALVIDGDSLALVGSDEDARKANAAQVVDAGGRLIVPGFTDAHTHIREGGFGLASVQLRDARTREEFVARIKAFAATVPAGTWITNGNWDHSLWGGELPTREWIDSVTPDHPVWINRLDGHMSLANSVALKLAQCHARYGRRRRRRDRARSQGRADRRAQGQRDGARRRGRAGAVGGDERPSAGRGDEVCQRARRDDGAQHGHVGRPGNVRACREGKDADDPNLRRHAARRMGKAA